MTKGDKIIIVSILIISFVSILFINSLNNSSSGNILVIEVNGKLYDEYKLDTINFHKIIEINTKYGYNKVEITKNGIRIKESDCPDKICVKSGYISNKGEMIVCLPNRLILKIEGDESVDGVAY